MVEVAVLVEVKVSNTNAAKDNFFDRGVDENCRKDERT
jgi:hypothetical protein